jgi:hypothetical protein
MVSKMSFMFYEVWASDEDGHNELIGTTSSEANAMKMAEESLANNDQFLESWVFKENDLGDLDEIARLTIDESGAIINV